MGNKLLNCLIAGAMTASLRLRHRARSRWRCSAAAWRRLIGGGGMHCGGGGHFGWRRHAFGGMGFARQRASRFAGSRRRCSAGTASRVRALRMQDLPRHGRSSITAFIALRSFGAPFAYAAYDSCWRRVWTSYGPQWVNVCYDYATATRLRRHRDGVLPPPC